MDVLLLSVTDAKSTVLLSTYQTRLVCAILILHVPWLKPYNNDTYLMYMLQQLEHRLSLTSTMVTVSLVLVSLLYLPHAFACVTVLHGCPPLGDSKTTYCDCMHALHPAHSVASQLRTSGVSDFRISFRKNGKSPNAVKMHRM